MTWHFYNKEFEFDKLFGHLLKHSAWTGHRKFAYDFVRFARPKRIVELGTHYGISFFSFCQAMRDGGIEGECVAVDTWMGDAHSGSYSNEAYQTVTEYGAAYREHTRIVQDTFDNALAQFDDESIDLLHIDGFHTLKAVTHDYQSWLPKLAPNGAVFFHDIAVTIADFGVFRLWQELTQVHSHHLQFLHSAGLGVLFPKGIDELGQEIISKKEELIKTYQK